MKFATIALGLICACQLTSAYSQSNQPSTSYFSFSKVLAANLQIEGKDGLTTRTGPGGIFADWEWQYSDNLYLGIETGYARAQRKTWDGILLFGKNEREFESYVTTQVGLVQGCRINWFSIDLGLTYQANVNYFRGPLEGSSCRPRQEKVTTQSHSFGLQVRTEVNVEHFMLGFAYRPSYYRSPEEDFYEHLIRVYFGLRFGFKPRITGLSNQGLILK